MPLAIFFPKSYWDKAEEIPVDFFRQLPIEGIILDLDNTIVARRSANVSPEIQQWIKKLKEAGFVLLLLTNAGRERVQRFKDQLDIEAIPNAMKPFPGAYRRAIRKLRLSPSRVAVIGDQIFTDIWGGNLAGAYTILIKPISRETDFLTTKFVRFLEKMILRLYFKRKKP